jgi:HlyD family secretion protein
MQKKRFVLILLWVTAVFLTGCASSQEETAPAQTVTAFVGDLSANATATGVVQPLQDAILSVSQPGRVTDVTLQVGDIVQTGDVLVQLDTADLALNVETATQNVQLQEANLANLLTTARMAEIAAAEAAVTSTQANLDDLLAGPTEAEIAAATANLRAAEASVWASAGQVEQTLNTITDADIAAAEAALAAAEANLRSTEITYTRNPDPDDIAANTALAEAREQVASAQARLNTLLAGPDTNQVNASRANLAASAAQEDAQEVQLTQLLNGASDTEIAAAQAQLAQAEASLARLLDGPSNEEIAAAEADLEQARINLADVEAVVADATILAPFDGVVTAVYVSPGEFASGPVVELVDTSNLEVILEVDEVDIGAVTVGQEASITLETWPANEIISTVTAVAPSAQDNNNALVTYDVHLGFTETNLPVLIGMTANAKLLTAQREDVLLVPNAAITADRANGRYFVQRVVGDTIEEVEITIGLRDNQYTQVTSGLDAGDELLLRNAPPNFLDDAGGSPFAE